MNALPAVLIGISFLIGIGVSLFSLQLWFLAIWLCYLVYYKKWTAIAIIPLAALYSWLLFGGLPTIAEPINRTGYFTISGLHPHQTPFQKTLLYKGTLYVDNKALPCSISSKLEDRKLANCHYKVTGTLSQRDLYDYTFKATSWEKIENSFSLAEWRYQSKCALRKYLSAHLSNKRVAILLGSLATGEVDDRQLRYEFGRLGLQHLLAISGFHFGVLLTFLALLLKFMPPRLQWFTMMALTTTYYLFIGDSPAVQRAWIIATLFLFAKIIYRPTTPVNLLGAALLIELIWNPLVAANLGFQFSFGSCFGILLLYRPVETFLRNWFPVRPAQNSAQLSIFEGLAYLISSTFRSAISLTFAVNLALLPLLFHHFGRFPLLSLLYNLFYPTLISLALFALLATLLIALIVPSLAPFPLLNGYTKQLLDLTSYPPLNLEYSLYLQSLPSYVIPLYLFALFTLSLKLQNKSQSHYT